MCKTLGIVTKPKSVASTHAQMRPRNIIHARAISYSRPRPAPNYLRTRDHAQRLGAGRGREYEGTPGPRGKSYLACTSREAPRFLALGQQVF